MKRRLTNAANNDFSNLIAKGQGLFDGVDVGHLSHDDLKTCHFLETVFSEHGLQLGGVADEHSALVALC